MRKIFITLSLLLTSLFCQAQDPRDGTPAANTGSLSVGLNTVQKGGGQLTADLEIGEYWRLTTNNITGTPTYTFLGGVSKLQ